ncbi:MAG TPA: chromosome segregation protein SMC [Candidatus Edwardsbacteria bacterium]|nr:chromosome segregation protein SMC [Candidatus Edwardsbacteria bacterium]
MYLSRLEIFGFKSFPQKLTLEIGTGITAIVGPNGCGKTNVVDAIRWCLGEQSTKTLRSEKMEDVIFVGTKDEPPLSLAEVTLVFSNEDGQLPLEYSEVSVTRRLFRSGESEYLLNNRTCRLKDIVDLFLNTGLGADTYSMIEPKMIEMILSEDPDLRRTLFEEAAGVAKYRLQKKAAQRRMEATTEDLLRLQDIIAEVEKRLRYLKRQASKSRVYERFTAELRELDLKVAALERDRLTAEEQRLLGEIDGLQQRRAAAVQDVERQERELTASREALEQNESGIAAIQEKLGAITGEIQQQENRLAVIRERRTGLEQAMAGREAEVKKLLAAIADLEGQSRSQQEGLQQASAAVLAQTEQLAGGESQLAKAESELTLAKLALSEARKELQEAVKREAEGKEALALLESRRAAGLRDLEQRQEEERQLRQELAKGEAQLAELSGRLDAEARALQVLAEEKVRLRDKARELQQKIQLANERIGELATSLSRLEKEHELLSGLQQRHEGYQPGVQHLIAARERIGGRVAPLADLIKCQPGFQAAIESALGERLQWVVVDSAAAAAAAVNQLRGARAGKATVIARDVPPQQDAPVAGPGVKGRAIDFVSCDGADRDLLALLLADTVVVASDADLAALAQALPGQRLVNPDGVVREPSGAMMAGELPQGQFGLLERSDRIGQLATEIKAMRDEHQRQSGEIGHLKRSQDETARAADDVDRELDKLRQQLNASERGAAAVKATLERNQSRVQPLEASLQQLRETLAALEGQIKPVHDGYQELAEANRDEDQQLAQRDRELAAQEQARNQLAAAVGQLRLALSQAQSQADRSRQEITALEARKGETLGRIQELRAQDQTGYQSIAELQQEAEALALTLEARTADRRAVQVSRDEMQKQSQQSLAALKQAETEMHRTRLESERIQQELSGLQIALGSVRNEFENIAQRIRAEYETALQQLERPEALDLDGAKARIEELRLRIKKLGPINFAAIEELKQEEERFGFMSKQRDDLLAAKDDLQLTIKRIDETARSMFLETLDGIKRGFVQIFQRLFIGGDAQIRLIGSDDPLESEIEILATPEGKSMKSITLLSGGEKTLTATALLFGIYLVKPAPFCVLDEIDAPLDDANVQRFCSMLRDFSGGTQFLVITHNKRTMEVADRLYGVTMEKAGISKVVSVKFS